MIRLKTSFEQRISARRDYIDTLSFSSWEEIYLIFPCFINQFSLTKPIPLKKKEEEKENLLENLSWKKKMRAIFPAAKLQKMETVRGPKWKPFLERHWAVWSARITSKTWNRSKTRPCFTTTLQPTLKPPLKNDFTTLPLHDSRQLCRMIDRPLCFVKLERVYVLRK